MIYIIWCPIAWLKQIFRRCMDWEITICLFIVYACSCRYDYHLQSCDTFYLLLVLYLVRLATKCMEILSIITTPPLDLFYPSCVGDSLQYSRKSKKDKLYDWCSNIVLYDLVGLKVNHLNILILHGRIKTAMFCWYT
jgi:hypothetical protein